MAHTAAAVDAIRAKPATVPAKDGGARELTRQESSARVADDIISLRERRYRGGREHRVAGGLPSHPRSAQLRSVAQWATPKARSAERRQRPNLPERGRRTIRTRKTTSCLPRDGWTGSVADGLVRLASRIGRRGNITLLYSSHAPSTTAPSCYGITSVGRDHSPDG
jgi:hypothetical protein